MEILTKDRERAKDLVGALYKMQATVFTLMLKSWGVHWNIVSENFISYHELMSSLYTDLIDVTDRVAEGIGSLGYLAPASMSIYKELSYVEDGIGLEQSSAQNMLKVVLEDLYKVEFSTNKVAEEAIKIKNKAIENMAGEVSEKLRVYIYKLRKTVVL